MSTLQKNIESSFLNEDKCSSVQEMNEPLINVFLQAEFGFCCVRRIVMNKKKYELWIQPFKEGKQK